MSSWGRPPEFRSRRTVAAGISNHSPRQANGREMVSGIVSDCLRQAIKAHSVKVGMPLYKLLTEMELGSGTWSTMTRCKPIAQTTALKVVKYLGTSVRALLTKYHQKETK